MPCHILHQPQQWQCQTHRLQGVNYTSRLKTTQGCLLILNYLHGNPGWLPYCCCQFTRLTWGKIGKGLSFLTLRFLSTPPCWLFSYLQHRFACQGVWQVKCPSDYWNCKVKGNLIHLPGMAVCSWCWAGQIEMRGRCFGVAFLQEWLSRGWSKGSGRKSKMLSSYTPLRLSCFRWVCNLSWGVL